LAAGSPSDAHNAVHERRLRGESAPRDRATGVAPFGERPRMVPISSNGTANT
jgi:hypothetical protein